MAGLLLIVGLYLDNGKIHGNYYLGCRLAVKELNLS